MTGSVKNLGGDAVDADCLAVGQVAVRRGDDRRLDAEPGGLHVHHGDQREVALIVEDGRTGELLEALRPGDVVDVGVRDENPLDAQGVLRQSGEDAWNVIPGVDDDGVMRDFVAQDGAVTLQRADWKGLADHVLNRIERYFLAGVPVWPEVWPAAAPERTEWSALLVCESTMVRQMARIMKRAAA